MRNWHDTGFLRVLLLGAFLVTALGCSSTEVESEYGPAAFKGFGDSFDWMPFVTVTGDRKLDDESLNRFVRGAIQRELVKKGFTQKAGAKGFLITYQIGTKRVVEDPYWDPAGHREGSIVVSALHPESKQMMWRGSVESEIDPTIPPSERRVQIDETIRAIFEEFPKQGEQ